MRERLACAALVAVACLLIGGAGAEGGGASGGLTQLASPSDCISSGTTLGCGTTGAAGLASADWVATSPDGSSVYIASFFGGSVAAFSRDPSTGALTDLGCVSSTGPPACADTAPGLREATSVAVSPDGKNVYATASGIGAVVEFARNVDGTLSPLGCIQDSSSTSTQCSETAHGLGNAYDVSVSPDGDNVYVAAGGSGNLRGAVAEFQRNVDGTLTQLAAPNDCIEEQGDATPVCGTTTGVGLLAVTALAVSPDGGNVYSVSDTSAFRDGDAPGAIAEFARDSATGALTQLTGADACVGETTSVAASECQTSTAQGLGDLVNIAISADGKNVYTASDQDAGAIAEFARGAGGALSSLGCVDGGGGCGTTATGLAASFGVAVSPDGENVYVAAAGNRVPVAPGVVALARAGDGTLSGLAVPDDCIQQEGAAGATCANTGGHGLGDALGVVVSPDGANVYIAASGGAVAAFERGAPAAPPANVPPTASFAATITGLQANLDATASSDSDGTIESYAWSFGDGSTGTGEAVSHTFAAAGTYTMTLAITDDAGAQTSVAHDVTVASPAANASPVAAFTVTTTVNSGVSVDASASSDPDGSIVSYAWNFCCEYVTSPTNPVDATGVTAFHSYFGDGAMIAHISLTVTDDRGATATLTKDVTMPPPDPTARFTYRSSTSDPATVTFDGSGSQIPSTTSADHYFWELVGQNGSQADIGAGKTLTYTFPATSGLYTVELIVVDADGGVGHVTEQVPVLLTEVPFTVETSPPSTVTVNASAAPAGTTFAWDFGDGSAGSGVSATHAYASAGAYTITLRTTQAGGATAVVTRKVSVPAHSVTVTIDGSGTGKVTSGPGGIDCGRACSSDIAGSAEATLAATPDPGSIFAGWSGGGCSGAGVCTVELDADRDVTATFDKAGQLAWSQTWVGEDALGTGQGIISRLQAVSCASQSLCAAAGATVVDGQETSQSVVDATAAPEDATAAWTQSRLSTAGFDGISCPTASLCVGVSIYGVVGATTTPLSGGWNRASLGADYALSAVSCPSTSFCVAAGDGVVLDSASPATGGWNVSTGFPTVFRGVSCPSSSFCVAVGSDSRSPLAGDPAEDVFVSTDPKGGASAWQPEEIGDLTLTAVSCPTASFCVAVGQDPSGRAVVAGSSSPGVPAASWTAQRLPGALLEAISCPTADYCVAGDRDGNLLTSTEPLGGPAAWSTFAAPNQGMPSAPPGIAKPYAIRGVSCTSAPTKLRCVAVDEGGDAFVGTQPVLTVSASGGTVTSEPAGIDCGATCSSGFFVGDKVVLTAHAPGGSLFTGWLDGPCSGRSTCAITIAGDTSVHAAFAAGLPAVTATAGSSSGGSGSVAQTVAAPAARFSVQPSAAPDSLAVTVDASSSSNATSYAWAFGDGGSAAGQKVSHTYPRAGTYTVRLTVTGPGGSDTAERQVTVPASAVSTPAAAGRSGTLRLSNAADAPSVSWKPNTFATGTVVTLVPAPGTLPGPSRKAAVAMRLIVTTSSGSLVTRFPRPIELVFPATGSGVVPAYSIGGTVWTRMPQLAGTTLPSGFEDGWYRDRAGAVHVLTLHATYFGVVDRASTVPELVARITRAAVLDVRTGRKLRVRVKPSLPARVAIVVRARGRVLARSAGTTRSAGRLFVLTFPRHVKPGRATVTVVVTAGKERSSAVLPLRLVRR